MADINGGKDLQLAHATNALNYGHLGTATYKGHTREWTFLRQSTNSKTFQSSFPFATVKETVYKNSTKDNETVLGAHNGWSSSCGPFARSVHLGLALAHVKEEESLSDAIITSLGQHDPHCSDRLAFGGASWLSDNHVLSGNATVPIAAFTSGVNGESIILTQIGRDRVTITDKNDNEVMVEIPTISCNNETSWTGNGEAVQQICFAATSGQRSTWMAARLLSSTTIFHPLFHRTPVPAMRRSNTSASAVQASILDANPVLTIPVSRTGGHPHADISFHPVNYDLLALIDQHGNWSTWRIDGKRSVTARTLFSIQLVNTGKVYTWQNTRRPPQADPYHDGWHKVCWVTDGDGNSDSLFFANRRMAVIHAPIDGERHSVSLGLGQASEAQWILDIKNSALHPSWIFVLTSTRVLCISTAETDRRDIPEANSHAILCSWQHFRGRQDITLSLTILETAHGIGQELLLESDVKANFFSIATIILLWSRVNAIVNAYRVNASIGHPPFPLSWVEPSLLEISDICVRLGVQDEKQMPLTLLMRPIQVQRPSKAPDEPLTFSLHRLVMLQTDRSVVEVLLQGTSELFAPEDLDSSNTILLPLKSYIRNRSSKYAELEELEDFVVQSTPEDLLTYPDPHGKSNEQGHSNQERQALKGSLVIDRREEYDLFFEGSKADLSRKRIEFGDYLQAIRRKLENPANTDPGLRLLSELSSPLPLVADVESSSATITSLAKGSSGEDQVLSIFSALPIGIQPNSALEFYQILVSHCLDPLQPEIPDRIRVNKERLARNVAVDLALAGTATRSSICKRETHAVEERKYSHSAPTVAITPMSGPDSDQADLTTHSQPTSTLPPAAEEHPAYLHLRTYTTLSDNAVTTATLAGVSNILAHLPSDAEIDPSTYDWRGTKATIAAEFDANADTTDPRARRRAEKQAQAKRKRTELRAKTAEDQVRQNVPPIIGSSQMVLPTRELQSSQVMAPERDVFGGFGPMTQPERGAFGTRLGGMAAARKDKVKKRAAGF
jgi:RNA polymerase I-specific transcription initiation factor RRN6